MFFKPRIFISSTLSENLSVRTDIEDFLTSVGAEAILYERNLTPSVIPMTYRTDILDVDFIIFIIKEKYGKKTESGISGTHEEFRIAVDNDIPFHVYIKYKKGSPSTERLKEEINKNQISFFYFNDDNKLLERIKATTFTIAKEIMLQEIEEVQLPEKSIKKISIKHDYDKAIEIISIIDSMIGYINQYNYIDTTLFLDLIWPFQFEREYKEWIFIDKTIEEIYYNMLDIYKKFSEFHSKDYTKVIEKNTIKVPLLKEMEVYRYVENSAVNLNREEYEKIFSNFMMEYNVFRDYIKERKLFSDKYVLQEIV